MNSSINFFENNLNLQELKSLSDEELLQIEGGLVPIAMAAIWGGVKIGIEVAGILYGAYYLSRS